MNKGSISPAVFAAFGPTILGAGDLACKPVLTRAMAETRASACFAAQNASFCAAVTCAPTDMFFDVQRRSAKANAFDTTFVAGPIAVAGELPSRAAIGNMIGAVGVGTASGSQDENCARASFDVANAI